MALNDLLVERNRRYELAVTELADERSRRLQAEATLATVAMAREQLATDLRDAQERLALVPDWLVRCCGAIRGFLKEVRHGDE